MLSRIKLFSLFLLCFVLGALLAGQASAAGAKVRTATAERVLELSDEDEEMVLLDARSASEYKQGHIRWSERVNKKQFTAGFFSEKVPSKNTVIVFYGNENSHQAALGAQLAVKAGYTDVYWFKGGWQEWTSKGLRMDQ